MYPHALGILHALKEKGIDMAVASRSPADDIAKTFLDRLKIQSMFVAQVRDLYSFPCYVFHLLIRENCFAYKVRVPL